MSSLRVGTACIDYAPAVGLPLMGHLRSDYASRGVHDPLCGRAVVFADSAGKKVALLGLDICMIDAGQVDFMRQEIARQCDMAAENILIAATHTHGGPSTIFKYTSPKADDEQIEAFLSRACQAVVRADADLHDTAVRVGYSREDRLSFNRRLKCRDGETHMNWETLEPGFVERPWGGVDGLLTAVSIERHGEAESVVVNFPLHPAILDYENHLYTADYPGYLAEAMSKIFSKDFKTVFFNGCCGNMNHLDYSNVNVPRRGFAAAQRAGYMLAAATREAMNNSAVLEGDTIAASREMVTLAKMTIDDETYEWAKRTVAEMKKTPPKSLVDGLPKENSAPRLVAMYESQHVEDHVEVMAVRIGGLGIVSLPGEVFYEFGEQIRAESPAKHTMVIELANGAIGYLPTREAFDQGGYEITPGATWYASDAGERLTASAINQLKKLFN